MAEGERRDDEESRNGEDGAEGKEREESGSGNGADVDTDEAGARAAEESGDETDDASPEARSDSEEEGDDDKSRGSSSDDDKGDGDSRGSSSDDDKDHESRDSSSDDDKDEKRAKERQKKEVEQEGESEGKAERAPDEDRDEDRDDRDRDDRSDEDDEEDRGPSPVKAILLGLATILFVFLGLLIFVKGLAPGWKSAIVLGLVWLLIAAALLARLFRSRRHLWPPVFGAFALIAAAFVIFLVATHVGGKTAKEKVVTGTKLSQAEGTTQVPKKPDEPPPPQNIELLSGKFKGMKEGSAKGEAKVVKLADNKLKLTITGLDVPKGPGQHVYLATGSGKDIKHARKLGKLKGTKGDQQYDIPETTDTDSLTTVVIYGSTFGVPYGRAKMKQQ